MIAPARLALSGIVALAAGLYAWGIDDRATHYYYSAAARSMSESWHAFVFGAVDPDALVGLDKVPGALWVQAISTRIFGFHAWALALPEALAAAGAVLLLYRLVRDWAGTTAALVAAGAFTLTPIVVASARANVPDAVLLFLLVLAAERCWAAIRDGRLWPLLVSGLVLGLAFDVKMLQAGLILPALYGTYLLAAPSSLGRRLLHLAASAGASATVSAVWLLVVGGIVFSAAGGIHPYYTVALAPAVAALFGAGFTAAATAWRRREATRPLLPMLVAVTAVWAFALLRRAPEYVRPAQLALVVLGAAAIALLVLGLVRRLEGLGAPAALGCALGASLVAPAAWSLGVPAQAQTVWSAVNPVAGPTPGGIRFAAPSLSEWPLGPIVGYLRSHRGDAQMLAAGSDSFVAGPLISATGDEILPMGGLNGDDPFPSVARLDRWVREGRVRYVLLGPRRPSPAPGARWDWTRSHCRRAKGAPLLPAYTTLYDCG